MEPNPILNPNPNPNPDVRSITQRETSVSWLSFMPQVTSSPVQAQP